MSTSQDKPETKDWSATQYLKFEGERTRPARDLLAQVPSTLQPKRIVDLGCGPGNSTAVLQERFPNAHLSGMDSSPDMIEKARKRLPGLDFRVADLMTYQPSTAEGDVDLYFSNAVFQWLDGPDRLAVIKRLMQTQKPGAVFAWQVPDNFNEYSHVAMRETAALDGAPWKAVLAAGKNPARELFQTPQQLYDELKPLCSSITIWHTYYQVILDSHEGIVEWVKGTGLQPFINPLNEEQREGFLREYLARLKRAYPTQYDGKVLLSTSDLACFRGDDRRRTEIACVAYRVQALVGSPLQQYTVYFLESAGLQPSKAFALNLGNNAVTVRSRHPNCGVLKTVSLAQATAYLMDIVVMGLTPYMINPSAWDWVGKAGFFFGGLSVLCTLWTFLRLPETGGRTYEELDILFKKKVSARKFAGFHVDAYEMEDSK
ncbi:hypothetical protein CDV55_102711 [Aspergillus turcosus]|nr:hypothetical protein CDV55_102711 [Aspergillus turcosus]